MIVRTSARISGARYSRAAVLASGVPARPASTKGTKRGHPCSMTVRDGSSAWMASVKARERAVASVARTPMGPGRPTAARAPGLDGPQDRQAGVPGARGVQARDGGRAACHQHQLGARPDQFLGQPQGEVTDDRQRLVAVRDVGGVGQVHDALGRQKVLQLTQHGQPAQAGGRRCRWARGKQGHSYAADDLRPLARDGGRPSARRPASPMDGRGRPWTSIWMRLTFGNWPRVRWSASSA